jgi:hypothetical protein
MKVILKDILNKEKNKVSGIKNLKLAMNILVNIYKINLKVKVIFILFKVFINGRMAPYMKAVLMKV